MYRSWDVHYARNLMISRELCKSVVAMEIFAGYWVVTVTLSFCINDRNGVQISLRFQGNRNMYKCECVNV